MTRTMPLNRHATPLAAALALSLGCSPLAMAAAPSTAPQVLLAITNSESMDGTTSGAIMVGSGGLGANSSSLSASSSPIKYSIPAGFTPPLNVGAAGMAPYTVTCGSAQCDNGPSRLNLAKAAIKNVISKYADTINFGLYTYSTSGLGLYNTWVYLMSPAAAPGAFTFTNTASASTVDNPCYNYSTASATVKSNCGSIAGLYGAGALSGNKYMSISNSSDAANINDVLYAGSGLPSVFVTSGTVSPADPYATYSLGTYNTNLGGFSVSYSVTTPNIGGWATTPTNAGYVPYSKQVMYAARGWGYGASQSATTGSVAVAMGTDPTVSTAFTTALAPETNSTTSKEIKAAAGQSGIGGLLTGANSYLNSLPQADCQSQYVVLLTDGLPTLDTKGKAWPPLGTVTATKYGLTATFNADGSLASTNSQALQDAINAITALYTSGTKTYVIGLGAGVAAANNPIAAKVLKAMAVAGHSNDFFPATDPDSLTAAFSTIVGQIYNESAVAAPVAPISVANGTSLEYQLTSFAAPMAGHVRAYAVAANGMPSGVESWDAGAKMNATNRATSLMAANATGTVTLLANVDAAAYSLTATTCVPDTATVVKYTVNPNYSNISGCSYLAGRQSNWYLGSFSTQSTGKYVDHPASGLLTQRYPTYAAYARGLKSRAPLLMFTSNDGFLYAVNPADGSLKWGWTSRNLLSKMQNYATFQTQGATNGGFAVVDAMDGAAAWGSYLVGSFQSGAEHFSVKLDDTATPQKVVYDTVVSGGTSPGDAYGTTGTVPMHQAPLVAYVGNSAFAVYVVNTGTTSTLYEVNVATGASSAAALSVQVSSALFLEISTNRLWLGGADGSVWTGGVLTGNATADAAQMLKVATTINPVGGAVVKPVLYVGYGEVASVPYFYALDASLLTVYSIGPNGWKPLWAASTTAGYPYGSTSFGAASAALTPLTAGSVVSDQPIIVGGSLLVPVYVPGSLCVAGRGYYDFFELASGRFPQLDLVTKTTPNLPLTYSDGRPITAPIDLGAGSGPAFAPSLTLTSDGGALNQGAAGGTDCGNAAGCPGNPNPLLPPDVLLIKAKTLSAPVGWRQR